MAARYIGVVIGGIGATLTFSSLAKNTLFHKEYTWRYIQLKDENGRPVPVDKTTRELAEDVLYRINLLPHVEAGIEFFTCKSQEPVYVGSLLRNTGCSIGIPAFNAIESEEDLNKPEIDNILNRTIESITEGEISSLDWTLEKELAKSFILSEPERLFMIGRIFEQAHSIELIVKDISYFFFALGIYGSALMPIILNKKTGWFKSKLLLSFLMSACVISFVQFSLFMRQFFLRRNQLASTVSACKYDQLYALGGIGYFSKMAIRNLALKERFPNSDYSRRVADDGTISPPDTTFLEDIQPSLTEQLHAVTELVNLWSDDKLKPKEPSEINIIDQQFLQRYLSSGSKATYTPP